MANIYTRSTDGGNADTGATWPLAKLDATGAAAIDAAGDTIWLSQAHAESTAGAITIALAGTIASPTRMLCGNDGAEPPTALATTGSITTTGTAPIAISGNAYIYGATISSGTGAGAATMTLSAGSTNKQVYEDCALIIGGTSTSSLILSGLLAGAREVETTLINCTLQFGGTGQGIGTTGWFIFKGGAASSGGSDPASFLKPATSAGEACNVICDGFDFTGWGGGLNLVVGGTLTQAGFAIFRNCKMPASWSGALWSTAPTTPGFRAEMINCDATDTNYRMWVEDYCGSIKDETTIVRTGGASDGTTPISWKMEASANAQFPLSILRSPEITVWNDTTGSAKTLTIEIVHDSVTALNDDQVFLEVQYLGTSGTPLALFSDDAVATVLATPAAQTSSSVTWTTTGITNVNKQKLGVTVTPQEKGYFVLTVCLTLASKIIYACPKVVVS